MAPANEKCTHAETAEGTHIKKGLKPMGWSQTGGHLKKVQFSGYAIRVLGFQILRQLFAF